VCRAARVCAEALCCVQTEQLITYISNDGDQVTSTIAKYVDKTFGYQHSFRWWALVISLLYILLLRMIITIATKTLNFSKR
jgi:ABC-type transport system involved in cytochrome bd biosynthesis fused ATPase/permease subunit